MHNSKQRESSKSKDFSYEKIKYVSIEKKTVSSHFMGSLKMHTTTSQWAYMHVCVYSHETEMVLFWSSCKAKPQKCWRTCYMFKHFFSPFNISNSLSCCASQTIKHVFGHGSLRIKSKGRHGGIRRLQTGKVKHAKPSCFPAHQRLQRLAHQTHLTPQGMLGTK